MEKGTQEEFKLEDVIDFVVSEIGEENLSRYHPSQDWIIEESKNEEEIPK